MEADDLALESLATLKRLSHLRDELNLCLERGFNHIARSRYHRGFQFGRSLPQDTNVTLTPKNKISVDDCTFEFQLLNMNTKKDEEKTIRHRNKKIQEKEINEKDGSTSKNNYNDVYKYLGIGLIPQELRFCQTEFERAVLLSCELSSAQNKLRNFHEKYQEQLKNQDKPGEE